MEQHQQAVNDPIATKLCDTAALEKIMQQAVLEAVEKARKLGFLKTPAVQADPAEYTAAKR